MKSVLAFWEDMGSMDGVMVFLKASPASGRWLTMEIVKFLTAGKDYKHMTWSGFATLSGYNLRFRNGEEEVV